MFKVHFTGYKEGIKKVSLSRLLKKEAGMTFAESKSAVDQLLLGKKFFVGISNLTLANELLNEAKNIGAICSLEKDSLKNVRVIRGIVSQKGVIQTLAAHSTKASTHPHRVR